MRGRIITAAILGFFFSVGALDKSSLNAFGGQADIEICYLIESVDRSEELRFLRNGKEYDGKTAAEHLRRKWKAAGDRVRTAEDFIRYCASSSTVSGQAYRVRLPDGDTVDAALFFSEKVDGVQGGE